MYSSLVAGLFGLNVNVCKTETLVTSRTRMEKMKIEDRCTNILSLVEHFMCREMKGMGVTEEVVKA